MVSHGVNGVRGVVLRGLRGLRGSGAFDPASGDQACGRPGSISILFASEDVRTRGRERAFPRRPTGRGAGALSRGRRTMKKLKLDLDRLVVESFEAEPARADREGTVQGH